MRIIKVNATESTNTLAREWYQSNKETGPFCLIADEQTSGRGQRGAAWVSNAGENLTMTVVYPGPFVEIKDQFILSAVVGLAVIKALESLKINNLKLKWPNDIMAANFKIGGILIENILSNGRISAAIIGLGLNVNQEYFPDLPKAASFKTITGETFELEMVRDKIIFALRETLNNLEKSSVKEVIQAYEKSLFRINRVSTFKLPNGDLLTGIIKGITPTGLLKVQMEDDLIKTFDLKELKLLF